MVLEDIATIRTGLVVSRKKANPESPKKQYKLLNLKCANTSGILDLQYIENFEADGELNPEFLTQKDDIIVRLSSPYTAIMISREEWCGYVVPSHFAIIRVDKDVSCPEYVLWILRRNSTMQKIIRNVSGSSVFGTISSGFFNSLKIAKIPPEKQKVIGRLQLLSQDEFELSQKLAAQKEIYNKLIINQIYNSAKRGMKK